MRAAFYTRTGPPAVLQVGNLPDPVPGPADVLIAGEFASVNPIDCYLRSGAVPAKLPVPFVPGCDLAGVVEAVGTRVKQFRPGDRVWTTAQGFSGRQGTCSETFVSAADRVYAIPNGVDARQVAAVGLVGATAHVGLVQKANVQPGETVLVRGGSGAVGLMVIQMARNLGARVLATAGSEAKRQQCLRAGAAEVIDYRAAPWVDQVRGLAPEGLDLFWDATREPDLENACSVMRERGRLILMAGRQATATFPVGPFYSRELSILGVMILLASPTALARAAADMNGWLQQGRLELPIAQEFSLADIQQAHQLQESITIERTTDRVGKILVALRDRSATN